LIVFVLAGCDLQPPPKKQAPTAQRPGQAGSGSAGSGSAKVIVVKPEPTPTGVPSDKIEKPPAPPPGAGTGSGSAVAPTGAMACGDIGVLFADIYVKTSKDASEKATLEQERSTLAKSTTREELAACTKLVRTAPSPNPATP
jgi:hypothetical protein